MINNNGTMHAKKWSEKEMLQKYVCQILRKLLVLKFSTPVRLIWLKWVLLCFMHFSAFFTSYCFHATLLIMKKWLFCNGNFKISGFTYCIHLDTKFHYHRSFQTLRSRHGLQAINCRLCHVETYARLGVHMHCATYRRQIQSMLSMTSLFFLLLLISLTFKFYIFFIFTETYLPCIWINAIM